MKILDSFLNKITMYRLTLYYLIFLVLIASSFGFLKLLPYNGFDIILSAIVAVVICFIANLVFSKIFKAVTNNESVFITALILVLIFPVKFPLNFLPIIAISLLAMGSKYLLTVEKRHVFNPAAVAVLMLSYLSPEHSATWWIGTPIMFFPVLIGGLLLIRKIKREELSIIFLTTFIILCVISSLLHGGSLGSVFTVIQRGFLSSAALFFAFVMLTEPLTAPTTKLPRRIYAIITGIIYTTPLLRIPGLIFTPEMALIAGNIYSYIVNPKYRLDLVLHQKIAVSKDTFVFDFGKISNLKFVPGQYFEWTLPHIQLDSRGNRRYFSISSAPHENLMMTVKFYSPSSNYKKALLQLENGGKIIASSLSGDFVLPKNKKKPIVFIAGGVGIAPFRSMIEDIVQKKEMVDIILVFANKTIDDILFEDTFKKAEEFGVKSYYVLTDKDKAPAGWTGPLGHIDENGLKSIVKDFNKRLFYISGPQLMVQNFEKIVKNMGVKRNHIKVDFFPGYSETSA